MEVFNYKNAIRKQVQNAKHKGYSVGFVPTMGALHQGHLSLVHCSLKNNDYTVVSIFVNPTQFNNPEDLKHYPQMLEKDLEILRNMHVDWVFAPEVKEMYPEKDTRVFDFGQLDKVMEGKYRQGHFNGVAQVVSRLFEAVIPDRAYFGKKDFQQFVIIHELTRQLQLPVEIVPCPIMREKDGLAMSSRNLRLTPEQRKHAPFVYQTLKQATQKSATMDLLPLKQWVTNTINADPYLDVEYFDIVDTFNLQSVTSWHKANSIIGAIAVYCGKVRLIDNIDFKAG